MRTTALRTSFAIGIVLASACATSQSAMNNNSADASRDSALVTIRDAENSRDAAARVDAAATFPDGTVLIPSSATLSVPLGFAQCVTATASLPNGETLFIGRAEGLIVESNDAAIAQAMPNATSIGECPGVLVAGVGEGRASLSLRVEGATNLPPTRTSLYVAARDGVTLWSGIATAIVGTGMESCSGNLQPRVRDDRSGFAVASALRVVPSDGSVSSGRVRADGAVCITGAMPGRSTVRVVHALNGVEYETGFTADVVADLRATLVLAHEMPVLFRPRTCVGLTSLSIGYRSADGRFSTTETVSSTDARVRCTPHSPLTFTSNGMVCVAGEIALGTALRLDCCVGDVCTANRSVLWAANADDRIELDPASYTRRTPRECAAVRTTLVSASGARLDVTRSGLVDATIDSSVTPFAPTYLDGSFCFDVSTIADTSQTRAQFLIADVVTEPGASGSRRTRNASVVHADLEIR